MKKYGIGRRLMAALLALTLIVSMSSNIWAAVGDMAVGDKVGKTGLTGNVDTKNTISWPIKIFDYLNDGMLFEYPNAGDAGDIPDLIGGAYGGGHPAPHFGGPYTASPLVVKGTDFTVDWGFTKRAYSYWMGSVSEFNDSESVSKVEAVNFKSPRHLRVVPYQDYNRDMIPWVISDFAYDDQAYAKDDVRYAVIVYRTNSLESGEGRMCLAWSTDWNQSNSTGYPLQHYQGSSTGVFYSVSPYVNLVANTDSWNYIVVDMKSGDLAKYWNNFSKVNKVVVDFTMQDKADSIDISHVAYFSTEFAATEFGKDAVAFDNDPGEFLQSHKEYYPEGTVIPINKPTTNSNGMDFSQYDSGGYTADTYKDWTTATDTGLYYLGTVNGVKVTPVDNGERSYVKVSNSNNTTHRSIYTWDYSGGGRLKYVTLVYKTTGFTADDKISFYVKTDGGDGSNMYKNGISAVPNARTVTLKKSEDKWTYVTYAISQCNDGDYSSSTYYNSYGMYLPACLTGSANAGKSLDIAFIQWQNDESYAATYGQQAADYMNGVTKEVTGSYTTSDKQWNTGNNVAFSMLYANKGGGWADDGNAGGVNAEPNGFYSYQIGKTAVLDDYTGTLIANTQREYAKNTLKAPVSDTIYLINNGYLKNGYQMSNLDLGYTLFNTLESGLFTAGLLKSGLTTVTGTDGKTYRVPDYKEDAVEYIAVLLRETLRIAQTDTNGNYNYNFVRGTANGEQYGYDANGKPMDLASALRKELNVVLPANGGKAGAGYAELGDYANLTDADKADLIGEFAEVKDNINTFVDAAYYLMMNLYVSDSYNQAQDEYTYLVLSNGTLSNGQNAYVFDGGFTTGKVSNTANTEEYRNSSQSAIVYDKKLDTISMSSALSKDQVYFLGSNSTTRFPFLPVTDAEGVYAGETKSPYFLDDGRGVMGVTEEGATFVNRNYNFAMCSNGEFVYHYDESLFFQFEGDDDVYLFINGELVLDIGGAHSVTDVSLNVNDYVDWARRVKAGTETYKGKTYDQLTGEDKARVDALNLKDGQKYTFDFYYMERHGWGSNCRIATNIVVTDPALDTDKQGYQGTDVNGDPVEVLYGGIVDVTKPVGYSFKITNEGDTKLYRLSFQDANIGVNLTYDGGLITYGAPTVTEFTASAATKLVIEGLNGMVNLDGKTYSVTTNEATSIDIAAGGHTLTLYQMNVSTTNVNKPFVDANVSITVGSKTTAKKPTATDGVYTLASGTNEVTVAGIRVTDKNGGHLDVSDLVVTVDGYSSQANYDAGIALDTFTIALSDADELKSFLTTLQDPNHQTGEEVTDELYSGEGLWLNATVKIFGMFYTLTPAQQAENVFNNTVFTSGYKYIDGTAPLKSQDQHRVYGLGEYEYYQWAGHTVHLDRKTLWADILAASKITSDSLYVYADQIAALNAGGVNNLTMEIVDKSGEVLSDSYNLYGNGAWGTYKGKDAVNSSDPSKRIIYYKDNYGWNPDSLRIYYWAKGNTTLTTWPGVKMNVLADGTYWCEVPLEAEYVIFNNGYSGFDNQTVDIAIPETAYTAVNWNQSNANLEVTFNTSGRHIFYAKITSTKAGIIDYVIAPIVFYVADAQDRYYVLDYGLSTEDFTASYNFFGEDDYLGDYGMTTAKFMGYCTDEQNPEYLGTFSTAAANLKNINRIAFNKVAMSGDKVIGDGIYHIGSDAAANGTVINYSNGTYSLPSEYTLSFTPTDFMDGEYNLWMAMVVYQNGKTPSALGGKNTSSATYSIDVHNEVQMLKKITVLPATVVYYEDDFAGVKYNDKTSGSFTHHGTGSGDLTQGISGETPYGQDSTYQTPANAQMSGNSMSKINISAHKEVAAFTFTGTGFEIISRTNAFDSASFMITVKDANGKVVRNLPIITEFDNTNGKVCAHAKHDVNGICTTCGQTVSHNYQSVDLYSYQISKNANMIIFNNGGDQNDDLAIVADGQWQTAKTRAGLEFRYMATAEADENGNRTFYFDNSKTKWGTVNVYAWQKFEDNTTSDCTGNWPGSAMSATGEKSCTICGALYAPATEYYLGGWINNGDYTGADYKFVDGKLTTKFASDSYVIIRSSNGAEFWTSGYAGDNATSASLYQNAAYADKFRVPGNTEVTLTLIENADGSLTLSCSTKGDDQHTLKADTVIYYDNSSTQWANVNIHYWGDNFGPVEWPGSAMTKVNGTDLYSFTVPAGVTHVIFNNKLNKDDPNGTQTGNIPVSKLGNIYTGDKWAIYNATTGNVTQIPQDSTSVSSDGYEIYQVPVIRVDGLDYGVYFVSIKGLPSYSDIQVDDKGNVISATMETTYLYIDGVRIYQPLTATNSHYSVAENGATFTELRNLILQGNAAVAQYVPNKSAAMNGSTIYTGNLSWTENRNGELAGGVDYVGNQVGSTNDYMLVGPNNEVYLNGNAQKQAVIFYVKKDANHAKPTLQIAARALDAGLFLKGEGEGVEATLYQGVVSGDQYAWRMIDTIQSGTEQYYNIDFAACPVTKDGYYQVALFVRSGMVSFTNVKTNGLEVVDCDLSESTTLSYLANGFLEKVVNKEGDVVATNANWDFNKVSEQMKSNMFLDAEQPDNTPDGDGSGNTGSEGGELNPGTGDTMVYSFVIVMLICMALLTLRKKLFRF